MQLDEDFSKALQNGINMKFLLKVPSEGPKFCFLWKTYEVPLFSLTFLLYIPDWTNIAICNHAYLNVKQFQHFLLTFLLFFCAFYNCIFMFLYFC